MTKTVVPKFSADDLEMAMEYIAYLMVQVSSSYGAWLEVLEKVLEVARRDDPLARAREVLTRVKGA